MRPRIFGPYAPIMRDYLAQEYVGDVEGTGVCASVYVQTNWPQAQAVEEVRWVQSCVESTGWPSAIVAYCDLLGGDVDATLERQARISSRMRGIRMQLHWHENPQYRFAPRPDICDDRRFRDNLHKLEPYGWLFELQVFPEQMQGAARLVGDFPAIEFVLVHAGMPQAREGDPFERWRAGMAALAEHDNCLVKLSGLGTFTHRVSARFIGDIARECLTLFGADRCMFGSNFPIEKLWSDFDGLLAGYCEGLAGLPVDDAAKVFFETANRVYGLARE